MVAIKIPSQQRILLDNVSWRKYTSLLRALSDRHLRLTYDQGMLEIMTLSHEHESLGRFLGRSAVTLTEELDLPLKEGGSTTFRRRPKQKGLEPDNCYWIASEAKVRGKRKIDLRKDPPPDLAIEVDITHSSLNRMAIYAEIRVPEVWRIDSKGLTFFVLDSDNNYQPATTSLVFPELTPADLMEFINRRARADENEVIKQFRAWIRKHLSRPGNSKPKDGSR
ncbi:MAG: Uma2 family endonuclease [Gemmataceae bacterium]|nr:Uma2 family endonuclease [Gemmataceae bacterium]